MNHPVLGLVRYSVTELPEDPDGQVEQTISLMTRYACEDSKAPILKGDAATAAQGDPIDDTWNWISRKDGVRRMQFIHDEDTARPWGDIGRWSPVEALIRPVDQVALPNPQGDCDDFSMYGASHLLARGVPVYFCTVAADGSMPDIYSHVYLVAYPRTGKYAGQRVPLDLSHGWYPGWETPNKFGKRAEWPVAPQVGLCKALLVGLLGAALWTLMRGAN